jgi:hypothetical protein
MRLLLLFTLAAGFGFGQVQQPVLDRAVNAIVTKRALSMSVPPEASQPDRVCSIRLREMRPLAEPAPMPVMKVQREPVPMPTPVLPAPPCPK